MIQIYSPANTNYDVNGDAVLMPTVCEIDTETWQLTIEHPRDSEGRWKLIEDGAVLKVPSFLEDDQLFRIFNTDKDESGVSATAQPIFFDSKNDCMLLDVRPTDKNGQQALDIMTHGTKYSGSSDITSISTAYYVMKNLMEALTGDDENSFINRWGGEVLYNNYEVIINERIGSDHGVQLIYGKNIPENGMSVEVDSSEVVTRIYPKAYNGRMMSNNGCVDSDNIDNYPTVKQAVMEFSDVRLAEDVQAGEDTEGMIICNTQTELDSALQTKCEEQYEAGIDTPNVTIKCDMVLLANTVNYADIKELETVSQGDTVYCKNQLLGVTTTARVQSLVYDCILDCVKSVVIGSKPYNYIDNTSSTISAADKVIDKGNNTLMADRLAGIINLMNTSLRAQKDIAQKQDVRAILFEDLDPSSPTFGALCIGTQGIQISKKRNATNTDWVWGTAINFESIIADYIITGILSDRQGKNSWNLDTGVLTTKDIVVENGTFSGDIKGSAITGGTINGTTINGATIVASLQKTYHIKSGDPEKIRNTIMGTYTPTSEEFSNWDIDCSGYISARDYLFANNILNGSMSGTFDMSLILGDVDGILSLKCVSTNGSRTFESLLNPASLTIDSVYTTRVEANNMEITQGDLVILDENKIAGGYITINTAGGTPVFEIIGNNFSEVTDSLHSIPIRINAALNPVLFVASYYEFNCAAGQGFEIYGNPCFIDFRNNYSTSDYTHRLVCNTGGGITAYPSISSASDIRLKKDIQMVDEKYLNVLNDLEIKTYRYKKNDKNLNIGLIAQDVLEIFKKYGIEDYPVVGQDEIEGMYSIDYSQITSLLVYGYQKQQKRIEDLESRLKILEEAMNK